MEITFEDYKKKIENYIQQSVSKKEAERLMNLYTQELEEFYQEKVFYSRNTNSSRLLENTNLTNNK